jgi:hypothetical protein
MSNVFVRFIWFTKEFDLYIIIIIIIIIIYLTNIFSRFSQLLYVLPPFGGKWKHTCHFVQNLH